MNKVKANIFVMTSQQANRIIALVALLFFASHFVAAQDIRRRIYDAPRKVMTEINRTKHDYETLTRMLSSTKRTLNPAVDTSDAITWSKKPYVPNSGMIHDYKHVYSFLHSQQEYTFKRDYDLKSIQWDSVNNLFYKNIGKKDTLNNNYEVIGWHPHWMGDTYKYYNYNLLSMISFYSYDIDPNTGSPWNPDVIDQLKKSSLPDSAARYGTKVLISVTSLERDNNHVFLSDEYVQDQFIFEILELLDEKKGRFAGIDLDFEEIDPKDGDRFTHFVKKLNSRLTTQGYLLILDIPYYNEGNVFDYRQLKDHVTYFNIMGYDFSGAHSVYPGSISPLRALDTQPSLETAVNDMLNLGVSGQQIILSLPLYGVSWNITNLEVGKASDYEESLPYYQVMSNYKTEYNPFYDPFSASFFFIVNENGKKKMCWFENEISLQAKFEWAKTKNLKGVGLWALGYERGAPEIWKEVSKSFGADSLSVISYTSKLTGPYGIVKDIIKYKKVIGLAFLVFSGFIILGFVLSLKDWRVRQVLFEKQSFRFVYSLVMLMLWVIGIKWFWFSESQFNVLIGLVLGGGTVLLINMTFTSYRNKLK
jgi:spore germination protein YaaH